MKNCEFIVSVVIITYGHEKFLEKCLRSIFSQIVHFKIELIISNDNSPDSSDRVIKNYLQNNVNDNIDVKYFCHGENMGMTNNFIWSLNQAKGKYVAYCEGDDCWLDDNKLAKQVSLLENHPDISVCCGGFINSNGEVINAYNEIIKKNKSNVFSKEDHFNSWILKSLTICFRNYTDLNSFLIKYKFARDIHLTYFLLSKGKGYYFNENFGLYNIHDGGTVSLKSNSELVKISNTVFEEFYSIEKDEVVKRKYIGFSTLNYKVNGGNGLDFLRILSFLLNPKYFTFVLKILLKK